METQVNYQPKQKVEVKLKGRWKPAVYYGSVHKYADVIYNSKHHFVKLSDVRSC